MIGTFNEDWLRAQALKSLPTLPKLPERNSVWCSLIHSSLARLKSELLINDKNASATNTMRKTCPNKMYVLVR
jgi:hypothetical protein